MTKPEVLNGAAIGESVLPMAYVCNLIKKEEGTAVGAAEAVTNREVLNGAAIGEFFNTKDYVKQRQG